MHHPSHPCTKRIEPNPSACDVMLFCHDRFLIISIPINPINQACCPQLVVWPSPQIHGGQFSLQLKRPGLDKFSPLPPPPPPHVFPLTLPWQERRRIESTMGQRHREVMEAVENETDERLAGLERERDTLITRVLEAEADAERQRYGPTLRSGRHLSR